MQNTPFFITIAVPTGAPANMLNPGTTAGGTNFPSVNAYIILTHCRLMNRTTSTLQGALWIGATGASAVNTEFAFPGISPAGALTNGVAVPANGYLDWYGRVRIDTDDFLTGNASAAGLSLEIDGEMGLATS